MIRQFDKPCNSMKHRHCRVCFECIPAAIRHYRDFCLTCLGRNRHDPRPVSALDIERSPTTNLH